MATPMISEQWPRFVLPVIRKEWAQKMEEIQSPLMNYFGIESSNTSVEYSQGVGSFGLVPEYNSSDAEEAAASIEYDNFNPLYETTFTHKEYSLGVGIERKLWDDDQMGIIKRRAQGLGLSFATTRATHAASVLNNAFSGVLGGDGVVLCSASHPRNKVDSTAISNLGTTALSQAAVTATIEAGMALDDDRGNPMPAIYDVLYVPVGLRTEALEIAQSMLKPGTANNDTNIVAGIRVEVDPYLTDQDNWFMIDSRQSDMHLLWYDRVMPGVALDPASDFNLVARYRGYMRYSFGWDDFRWIYGHNVT